MKKIYIALIGCFVALVVILGSTVGPFMATGVPGILIRGSSPNKGFTPSSAVTWTDSWSQTVERFEGNMILGSWAHGYVTLSVNRHINIEVTPVKWVAQDKPINSLFNTTADKQQGYNMTVYPNRYGFGIRYYVTYEPNVVYQEIDSGNTNPWFAPSIDQRRKDVVQHALEYLINEYNKDCYIKSVQIYSSVDAPTLGADQKYALNPNYIGVMDAYLISVEYVQPQTGYAAVFTPKDTSTPLDMFNSIEDIQAGATPLWHASSPTLLKPDEVYWFEHYAPAIAYFKTTIVQFGNRILLDTSKAFPQFWTLETGADSTPVPAVTQWFRLDLGFKTSDIYDISGIELPSTIKEQIIKIVIPTTPNQTPHTEPISTPTSPWDFLGPLYTILVVIIIVVMVILIVYIYVNAKYKGEK